jgi:hypothetical protein
MNKLTNWFFNNSWSMIVAGVAITLSFAYLVSRVEALEKKVEPFPSYDYFELKFNTIQDQVEEVKLSIKEHRETE